MYIQLSIYNYLFLLYVCKQALLFTYSIIYLFTLHVTKQEQLFYSRRCNVMFKIHRSETTPFPANNFANLNV